MDSALRDARLRKFCPSSDSQATAPVLAGSISAPDSLASVAAAEGSASHALAGSSVASLPAGAGISSEPTMGSVDLVQVLNLLVEIKTTLENLPQAMAAAMNLVAKTPAQQHPPVVANGHDEDEVPPPAGDACGVCHMPMVDLDPKWAFDNCGHYPYCAVCTDQVTPNGSCPYCSVKGTAILLKLD